MTYLYIALMIAFAVSNCIGWAAAKKWRRKFYDLDAYKDVMCLSYERELYRIATRGQCGSCDDEWPDEIIL